ncbi:MAG: aminopeptidase [Firmicutes bacterium]|nr:aminopeptidase [Bacillota bacterium]
MIDPRLTQLAKNLVNYSVAVKKGDNVMISASETETPLVLELIKEVYKAGGHPFVEIVDAKISRQLAMETSAERLEFIVKHELEKIKGIQCFIGIRGGKNSFEMSDVPNEKKELIMKITDPIQRWRVDKTRWVVLRYPNESMSQLASMSTEKFTDYYFNVCGLDYKKMAKAMDGLVGLMKKTDKVRIVSPGTDITFSIKGVGIEKCSGLRNIPDGEVFTAPVKNSVNGVIQYNCPSIHNGIKHENVCLVIKDGKIVEFTGSHPEQLKSIFDTDEGAKYIGEFAIGVNPYINEPIGDILFDEKITGSLHFTPGASYEDAGNGNKSAIHWDLVLIQTPEFGGGQIYFDDVLIRDNGRFLIKELFPLNPENLK